MKWIAWGMFGLALGFFAPAARADVRRAAIVVGSNAGSGERPALRYAETDAEKFAQLLVELGGFGRSDVYLLRGVPMTTLRDVLAAVRKKVELWHAETPGARLMLLFYFSGHSNGRQLELGSDRFEFSELKEWMAASGSDVRLAIIDSCKSGSVLGAKGGTPGQAFDIQLTDSLATSGDAVLTSSAANESALESEELRGSFFSHSLISGLRGAADANRDGHVTLAEAYQHAFARTLAETSNTVYGPQHPGYDYRLSGQGDLILTEFSRPPAALELPEGFDRILVTSAKQDQVVAEVGSEAARRISVQPGEYAIRAFRGKELFGATFAVGRGETRTVPSAALEPRQGDAASTKGGPPVDDIPASSSARGRGLTVGLHGGAMGWVDESAPPLVGVRVAAASRAPSGASLGLEVVTSAAAPEGGEAKETIATVGAGYRFGAETSLGNWTVRPSVQLDIAGGVDRRASTSIVGAIGPGGGVELAVGPSLSLSVLVRAPVYFGRRNEEFAVRWAPSGWLGMVFGL
jgi:hypothetical protein